MKRGTLLVFASIVFVLVLAGLVMAKDNDTAVTQSAKNMTYGQCVVEGVRLKNTCYDTAKQVRADCTANATGIAERTTCRVDYNKDMRTCKMDLRAAKKSCIQKAKPQLWERLRYSLI